MSGNTKIINGDSSVKPNTLRNIISVKSVYTLLQIKCLRQSKMILKLIQDNTLRMQRMIRYIKCLFLYSTQSKDRLNFNN